MAFFDKLGGIARDIGGKASDSIETGKLNSKIKAEEKAIAETVQRLGAYYYGLHQAGTELTQEGAALCAEIDGHNAAIAQAREEIERIKAEQPPEEAPPQAPEGIICASCGAQNPPGTKFCNNCGAKQEAPPAPRLCACGAQVAPGMKFCGGCGASVE
ncbi:MAG: zinc ribbon domain-containing protein [Oscillospiraceae bacterium]|jgi:ribosomal protein L40E|nr:zinc ribbon domain-containing protein [Oscillospiraceae bacterium]